MDHPSKELRNALQSLALQDLVIVLTFIAGLEGDLRGLQFGFLRAAFAQYLTSRLKTHHEDVVGFSSVPLSDHDKYITVTEARRLLKLSHDSLLDLMKNGKIAFAIRDQARTVCYLLRLPDVENVKMQYE